MTRSTTFLLALGIFFLTMATHAQKIENIGSNAAAGKYLQTADATIYYEVYGSGDPVVLLHGGLFGSISEFTDFVPELAKSNKVIAIATRGHKGSEVGKTALSYQLFAEDFAAVIQKETPGAVTLIGFSDGAISAYYVAVLHPELVKRMINAGGPLGLYGYTPQGRSSLDLYDTPEKLEKLAPEFVKKRKLETGASWEFFVNGLVKMYRQEEYISREKIHAIQCPVMIAGGDHDEYTRTEHLVEIYKLLPKGQLAVIPGSDHVVFDRRPALMMEVIKGFIARKD